MSNEDGGALYRQSDALREILTWSEDRDLWQRDALRQLFQGTGVDDIDLDRLEEICTGVREDAVVLDKSHLLIEASAEQAVSLTKMTEIAGVNALVSDQELSFGAKGITIIYGDNGSGKSGYCRVLKHACRSRDQKFSIHPDISDPAETPQTALITFDAGGAEQEARWSPEIDGDGQLGQVSIFDSRSANTHVQSENSVAYTPLPMRILESLGDLCDQLKARLDAKAAAIAAQTPLVISNHSLSASTAAGKYMNALSGKSDVSVLDMLCELSGEETRRLETLRADLAQDPQQTIRKLRAQKDRLEELKARIVTLEQAVSDTSLKELAELRGALTAAQVASKSASEDLFAASPLPEIGSDAWKLLWEAARAYSDEHAYPGKTFPNMAPDTDLCVLCQQPLTGEAVERKKTFEAFVKGTTKAAERRCEDQLKTKVSALEAAKFPQENRSAATTFLKEELSLEDISEMVDAWTEQAQHRLQHALEDGEVTSIVVPNPTEAVATLMAEFDTRIGQLAAMEDAEGRAKLEHEKRALDERLKLADIREDVVAQIERLRSLAALKEVAKTTARRPSTNKNKELSEKLVTGALRDRFAREIDKLRLNSNPLELRKTRDSKGQSYFQVEFVKFPGQPLGDILSEGEHRCVALAAFLAELVTSKEYSGIVFDDPMSSLDHMYRVRVARRLAEEAQHRQVVIFTHDLGFLFEVKREAEGRGVPLHYQHVRKRAEKPGHVSPDLPLKAKQAPALVAALRTELKEFKGQFDTVAEMRRVAWAKGIIEQLGEAWDQVIADFIEPVLGRFDNKIRGSSIYKLLALTKDDVETMNAARGRLSEDLHNVAGALNPEEVTHEQLSKEVTVIHDFIQSLASRPKPAQPKIRLPLD